MRMAFKILLVAVCFISCTISQECGGGDQDDTYTAPPKHANIVLIGATGDLAKKYLWKALFDLFSKHHVKGKTAFTIYACARSKPDDGRKALSEILLDVVKCGDDSACRKIKGEFVSSAQYHQLKDESHYLGLAEKITENTQTMYGLKDADWNSEEARLFYLSIPPNAYARTAKLIHKHLRPKIGKPWFRIVIEKPFGSDKKSAVNLSEKLNKYFKKDEIYRIDHYLGKPIVKSILPFREANSESLEPLWNNRHIERVEIVMKEAVDVRGRISFYDEMGVIRDVMQNHLTEILALIAMELPGKQSTINNILSNKLHVLQNIAKLDVTSTVVGQYHEYPAEAQMELNRASYETFTPTFAASVLYVNTPRWKSVPFVLTSGKKLDEKASYVRIIFKNTRFCVDPNVESCNDMKQLIFYITSNDVKKPVMIFASKSLPKLRPILGWKMADWELENDFFGESLKDSQQLIQDFALPDAYTTLMGAVFEGQRHLFTSQEMMLSSWDIWNDVILQMNQSQPRLYQGQGQDSTLLDFQIDGRRLEFSEEQSQFTIPFEQSHPTYATIPSDFIGQQLVSKPTGELIENLANMIQQSAKESIAAQGVFHLALSGGLSPRVLLRRMSHHLASFPWHQTHIWFVDERCVSRTTEGSNLNMVQQELLLTVDIPYTHIHPMPVSLLNGYCSADDNGILLYENEVLNHVTNASFDFIVLGVGMDMHTASLFPQQPELAIDEQLVAIATLPDSVKVKEKLRMTLTFKGINQAKRIAVLVTGKIKHRVLEEVAKCDDVTVCPIRGVTSDGVTWYIDHNALFG